MGDYSASWMSWTRGIGFRTAFAVNLVLLIGVASFITFDYVREMRQRVKEKMAALDDEAMTLHQATVPLIRLNPVHVQSLLDKVCARMSDDTSPGHHIVVETDGKVMQSRAHQRESDEIVQAIQAGASETDRRAAHQGADILVGVYREGGVTVYIAEELEIIRKEVRAQIVFRSFGLILFGIVMAAAVNLFLHKLIVKPLRRLAGAIDAIRGGKLGTQTEPFGSHEMDRLSVALNEMSQALAREAERRRFILEKARLVQENLLPQAGQAVPCITVSAIHRPAEDVAGDFYDVVPLPDGSVLCCVADVVGHGVPAAMVATILKVLFLDAAEVETEPGQVIRRINKRFTAVSLPEDFASLLVVRWDPERRVLCYANAGHEPGLLCFGTAKPTSLAATGPLLGLAEGDLWESRTVEVVLGTVLVMLTDGVTEAMDRDDRPFGRERLSEVIGGVGDIRPPQLLATLDAAVQRHRGECVLADDYTLVVMQLQSGC